MECALPLTGSSGMPRAGQNMRDSVDHGSELRFKAKTKKPSTPSSLPSATRVSLFGASVSRGRESAMGTRSRVPPLRATRAGMTSCSWVACRRRASAARSVVLNGSGVSNSGTVCRNSMRAPGSAVPGSVRAVTSMMPVPECWRQTPSLRLPRVISTVCAATVACPTKGASLRALKKRSRTSWSAPLAANTNATSACENSRATASRVASLWPSASSTTVAGLPENRVAVNASTWKMRKSVSAAYSKSFARIRATGYTSLNPGVVRSGLRCGKSNSRLTCEPVEPEPVNPGVGKVNHKMRAAVEISMYPLTGEYRAPIEAFIDRLNTHPGLQVLTNALATQIWGPLDQIMAVLAEEMARSAAGAPQLVFVMKVLPGLAPPDSAPQ